MAVWYRILQAKWLETAMTGGGARLYGGRWNPVGFAAVYLAQSRALAALEILVHAPREALLAEWVCLPVEVPDALVETAPPESLPDDWREQPTSESARRYGAEWLDRAPALGLRLPSVIVPQEFSLLLNPEHPAAGDVETGPVERFPFDPRLTLAPVPAGSDVTSPSRPAAKSP